MTANLKLSQKRRRIQSSNIPLDATEDDFEEENHQFRIRKKCKTEAPAIKRRGRPKMCQEAKSTNTSTSQHRSSTATDRSLKSDSAQSNRIKKLDDKDDDIEVIADFPPKNMKAKEENNSSVSDKILLTDSKNSDSGSKGAVEIENKISDTDCSGRVTDKDYCIDEIFQSEADLAALLDLEKSVCSNSEKLCPSCKHIVTVSSFSDHFSECLRKFRYRKEKKTDGAPEETVLPCPICLKPFTSDSQRIAHIKSCGLSHGLSLDQMLIASRLQEKQRDERLSLGLPLFHAATVQTEKKDTVRTASKNVKSGKNEKDPDLELAVAMSRSLVEQEKRRREEEEDALLEIGLPILIQEERRNNCLQLSQCDAAPSPPAKSSRRKKNTALRKKTLLMTRTDDEREKLISEKVASILTSEISSSQTRPATIVRAKGVLKLYQDEDCRLWNFAHSRQDRPVEDYYVAELQNFIKIQDIEVGGLLKHFSQVPGRLNYTVVDEECDEQDGDDMLIAGNEKSITDNYYTQLALAELVGSQELVDFSIDDRIAEDEPGAQLIQNELNDCEEFDLCPVTENRDCSASEDDTNANDRSKTDEAENSSVKSSTNNTERLEEQSAEYNEINDSATDCPAGRITGDRSASVRCDQSFNYPKVITREANSTQCSKPGRKKNEQPYCCDVALRTKFLYDWSSILASGNMSDLVIHTKDGDIPCHSLVLSVRCPNMIGHEEDSDVDKKPAIIDLHSTSYESVYEFLIYLYTGSSSISSKSDPKWLEVYDLAIKYECNELMQHLESVYKASYSDAICYRGSGVTKSLDNCAPDTFLKEDTSEQNRHAGKCFPNKALLCKGDSDVLLVSPDSSALPDDLQQENLSPYYKVLPENMVKRLSPDIKVSPEVTVKRTLSRDSKVSLNCQLGREFSPLSLVSPQRPLRALSRENSGNLCHRLSPDIFGDSICGETVTLIKTPAISHADVVLGLEDSSCKKRFVECDAESVTEVAAQSDSSPCDKKSSRRHRLSRRNLFPNCSNDAPVSEDLKDHPSESKYEEHPTSHRNSVPQNEELPLLEISHSSLPSQKDGPVDTVDLTLSSDDSMDNLQILKESNVDNKSLHEHCELTQAEFTAAEQLQRTDAVTDTNCTDSLPVLRDLSNSHSVLTPKKVLKLRRDADSHLKSDITSSKAALKTNSPKSASPDKEDGRVSSIWEDFEEGVMFFDGSPAVDFPEDNILMEDIDSCSHMADKSSSVASHGDILHLPATDVSQSVIKRCSTSVSSSVNGILNGEHQVELDVGDETLLLAASEVDALMDPNTSQRRNFPTVLKSCERKKLYKSKSCNFENGKTALPNKISENWIASSPLKTPDTYRKWNQTITPMPNYRNMVTPELKKELDKYGIRKMSRRKAITLLTHIYDQLHPFVSDIEDDCNSLASPVKASHSATNEQKANGSKDKKNAAERKPASNGSARQRNRKSSTKSQETNTNSSDNLNSSLESNTSLDGSQVECLEETHFADHGSHDEEEISSTQQETLETQLRNFIVSDKSLYEKVLLYDPLWASELLALVKTNGIRCNMKSLIKFLDHQCITFRLPFARSYKRRKRSPQKSPKKKL